MSTATITQTIAHTIATAPAVTDVANALIALIREDHYVTEGQADLYRECFTVALSRVAGVAVRAALTPRDHGAQ